MKKIFLNVKYFAGVLGSALLFSTTMGLVGCKEEIDESNFAIKTEQTVADFIDSDPNFSMIKSIFLRVRLGASDNASPIYSVLTARGNYTVFLPTNDAVQAFVTSKGVTKVEELTDEQANLVAKSCIMDHENSNAYETADFPTSGSFDNPNLNDRLLSCSLDEESNYIINGTSKVIDEDNEVSNGFVHVVDAVVAPSALTLDKLIAQADNMKVFSYLLQKTTWADSLHKNLDLDYEDPDRPLTFNLNNVAPFKYAQHRYMGYTAFIEPDSIYKKELGLELSEDAEGNITNGDDFLNKIKTKAQELYGTEAPDDYANPANAVNRYVAYHLLPAKMAYNKLNHHYNEYNYKFGDSRNPQRVNMPTNVWDYYTTMGQHPCILMVTQVGDASQVEPDKQSHPVYLNRISKYANGPEDDYKEIGIDPNNKGYLVSSDNGANDNNGLNGYYFPIDKLLFYTTSFRNELMKTRMRMDMTALLPELLSNNVRGTVYTHFEKCKKTNKGYFDNITRESPDTKLLYLMPQGPQPWRDYQGDEFMVSGLYDFTLKMPPVPVDGTYEIRMGVAQNSLRGMCQIYFGSDPDRLIPAGLPYDMRQPAQIGDQPNPAIPWLKDTEDWSVNFEQDKLLRNQGYMKGPQYFTVCNGEADTPGRSVGGGSPCLRRIITVADMKANTTYYLRFKSALKKTDSQFFIDYVEYASTAVYNGPTAEDIW